MQFSTQEFQTDDTWESWEARNAPVLPKSAIGDDWDNWNLKQENWQSLRQGYDWNTWFGEESSSVSQNQPDEEVQEAGYQALSETLASQDIDSSIMSLILEGDGVRDLPPSPTPESAGYGDSYHNIYGFCNSNHEQKQNNDGVLGFFASFFCLIFQPSKRHRDSF